MALHDELAHCFMALHDTKLVDCLALGTHRHHRSSERSGIVALLNLSQGIVIELLTLPDQSHSPVLYLLLLAFFSSLHQLLTYLRSNSQLMVVSRGLSVISTLYSTSCITITGNSDVVFFESTVSPAISTFSTHDLLRCVLNLSSSFKPSGELLTQVEIIECDPIRFVCSFWIIGLRCCFAQR